MIDKIDMYGNSPEDSHPVTPNIKDRKIDIIQDGVIIESNGKKITVVSKDKYDKMVIELEKTQKQLRILTTEIQQIKRVINNMSKSMVDSFRDRFGNN